MLGVVPMSDYIIYTEIPYIRIIQCGFTPKYYTCSEKKKTTKVIFLIGRMHVQHVVQCHP